MPSRKKTENPSIGQEASTAAQTDETGQSVPSLDELLSQMDAEPPDEPPGTDPSDGGGGEAAPIPASEAGAIELPEDEAPNESVKPKRAARRKKDAVQSDDAVLADPVSADFREQPSAPKRTSRYRGAEDSILTIEAKAEVMSEEERAATIWHDVQNANRTKRILTGIFSGIENSESSNTIAVLDYKGIRVVIPAKEMMFNKPPDMTRLEHAEYMVRQNKLLSAMLGAEIDFISKGIDSTTKVIVASRREAMLKKRQLFYLNTDASGSYRIYENRIVQARIIAVAEKVVRIEAFGVECSILNRDISWDWIGDARERYSVGDHILVRIQSVRRNGLEDISIKADIKSITDKNSNENLKKCKAQGKYAGRVVDVHNGVVYIRLSNGANAIAHSCMDRRMPGKKDDVSFAVTQVDEERDVALGIITRIIKQNL